MAERVIARLAAPSTAPTKAANLLTAIDKYVGEPALVTGRKPPNILTLPEMIMDILKPSGPGGELHHGPAMTPKQLTDEIRRLWWPTVTPSEVSPIAWRMAKRGELVKAGSLYHRPDPFGGAVSPPEGDEPPEDGE